MAGTISSLRQPTNLPDVIPVFPLSGALLLPRGQMPLNVFEPRYLEMVDAVLGGDRLIGIVQPRFDLGLGDDELDDRPPLCGVGCAGRITAFQESDDGRYVINLTGVARFQIVEELESDKPFRLCRITTRSFAEDFVPDSRESDVDRGTLLETFRAYLDANELETDWPSVERASNEVLVNALSMMSPYGPAEKQALLEAPDLKARSETLIAITEMELVKSDREGGPRIN